MNKTIFHKVHLQYIKVHKNLPKKIFISNFTNFKRTEVITEGC